MYEIAKYNTTVSTLDTFITVGSSEKKFIKNSTMNLNK